MRANKMYVNISYAWFINYGLSGNAPVDMHVYNKADPPTHPRSLSCRASDQAGGPPRVGGRVRFIVDTMRVELIGRFKPCMAEIYIQILCAHGRLYPHAPVHSKIYRTALHDTTSYDVKLRPRGLAISIHCHPA